LARLSTNANNACWARPRRKTSRLTCSMLAASRSSALPVPRCVPLVMRSRTSAFRLECPCRSSQKTGLLAGPCAPPLNW
jgi:hypothetical protein